ncbi:YitT family protein [Mycoplasma sp. 3341]|uniref:YitT family protein n=1 Tax=Mycoplasma sp. 3341 TaxID=3447506 RepID=UPI003F65A02A
MSKLEQTIQDADNQEINKKSAKKAKKAKKVPSYFDVNPYNVNFLNVWKKFPKKLAWMFISALLFNIGIAFFLGKAATVASGFSALIQSLTYTLDFLRSYFALLYLCLNLPFIIIFWKKNSRLFMILTTYWLIFQVISELIFNGVGQNYPIKEWLDNDFSIYYTRHSLGQNNETHIAWNVYSGTFYNVQVDEFGNKIVGTWKSWKLVSDIKDSSGNIIHASGSLKGWKEFSALNPNFNVSVETWPIIIYTLAGALLGGTAAAIAWKNSGSTAGSDVIIYYISKVKKMSVGKVSFFVACMFAGFSILMIGGVELGGLVKDHPWNLSTFVVRVISTILYIGVYNLLITFIYPKYRKIKITIYTTKINEICEHFKAINYWHGYNIVKDRSGFTGMEKERIETIALFLEQQILEKEILKIDPKAWISVQPIMRIRGDFDTKTVD